MSINFTIDPYTDGQKVEVTFFDLNGSVVLKRKVNAVFDINQVYDETATLERVSEVALGVAVKLDLGVLTPTIETPTEESDGLSSSSQSIEP